MLNKILTIAIPTFNRPEKVLHRLKELVDQCTEDVEILIVDNASEIHVEEFIGRQDPEIQKKAKFHRNRFNIGLAANICRCYEVAEGEWVWTLGDDDVVCCNAVDIILRTIERYQVRNIDGINFSTGIHTYATDHVCATLLEYCESLKCKEAFSNALFLSSCVFKSSMFQSHLRLGYMYAYSAAPHIAVPIQRVSQGGTFVQSTEKIVEWEHPPEGQQWNRMSVAISLPTLMYLQDCSSQLSSLEDGVLMHAPAEMSPITALKRIFSVGLRSPRFWKFYYISLLPSVSGLKQVRCCIYALLSSLADSSKLFRSIGCFFCKWIDRDTLDSSAGADRI
jgi:hypothetical protein